MGLIVAHAQRSATFDKKLFIVYVINDVVHRCKKVREAAAAGSGAGASDTEARNVASIVSGIRDHLPLLLRHTLQTPGAAPAQQDRIIKVLKLWADRGIFEQAVVNRIEVRGEGKGLGGTGGPVVTVALVQPPEDTVCLSD